MPTRRSCAPSSRWRTSWASPWWPKASRPTARRPSCASSAASRRRVSSLSGRWPQPTSASSLLPQGFTERRNLCRDVVAEGTFRFAIPVARVGDVALHEVHDAVRPAGERRVLVLLHDLVGCLPVSLFKKTEGGEELVKF